ncbi:magnesium transporter [Microvirga thermotolerans]|uniref:Magnesium transporter MgtE n=1 Tax=Microvirga thermotolerans TaxID=2651334 RepID=A0A5P9JYD9_9HYPH|nr:magnesium transporter [Microvirga thermotolerans]QFU16768.1 magnesium transporter [Microvirga thermotolerans]
MQDVENRTPPPSSPSGAATAPLSFRDGNQDIDPAFVDAVSEAIRAADAPRLQHLVEDFHESDLGDLLEALEPEDRPRLIELLGPAFDFAALTEVDDAVREEILEELETSTVAEGVRELDHDDAVYILEDLDEEDKAEILEQLPPVERVALQRALEYPEGSAGRRMQNELIAVPPFWTVGQTIDFMRETENLPDTFYEIFVIDPGGHLLGAVPLDKLLRSKRPVTIQSIMDDDPDRVRATDPQEDAARLFQRYNLVSAAVTDEAGRLVGVLMVDDIVDVLDEEADADIKQLGGVNSEEELSDTVWDIVKSRSTWLFVNLCTALLSASVINAFSGSLQKMVALAVLMPIVASMGGNAGTQTMTVAVRALATRELGRANAWRIIRREMVVGLLNGAAFALLLASVAVLWFGTANLGPVIGLAIVVTLVSAAFGGIVIPLALSRLGVDPAVSSGPLVTTITDVVGFFSFLGIATLWFGL